VVLYFFWDFARHKGGEVLDGAGNSMQPSLGSDAFSAVLLVWAPSPNSDGQFDNGISSSSDGSSETGFKSSVMVAALLVLCWAILLAAPIATSAAEGARRREKVMAFKNSTAYEFLMVVLSRLLTVWIIATLMRSTSCVHVGHDAGDDGTGFAVLSTAQEVSCGGPTGWWASMASLSLLAYYMLTSSVMHADDADLLRSASATAQTGVKFSPVYALCVRAAQFFVCAACFTGFYANSALVSLVPILGVVVVIACLPAFMALWKPVADRSTDALGHVCSVATVGVLRSAGFLCVAWTAIVCIVRSQGGESGIFDSETTVYVGWGVVYAVAILLAVLEDQQKRREWESRVLDSGLTLAVNKLLETVQSATVLESVYGRPISAPATDATPGAALTSSPQAQAIERYRKAVQSVRSYRELSLLLLRLEQVRPVAFDHSFIPSLKGCHFCTSLHRTSALSG
jgi:hypothetical protein